MLGPIAYLMFPGNAREAMEFYARTLGGKIEGIFTAGQAPKEAQEGIDNPDFVMHVCLLLPNGGRLMASDCPPQFQEKAQGFSVSLHPADAAEGERLFKALAEGGRVTMAFGKTFWSDGFGACVDRFGTPWMVNSEKTA